MSGHLPLSQLVDKYVCYGNSDGGFCWGRIKAVGKVNTRDGEKDVFILTDRTTCPGKPYKAGRIVHHRGDTLLQVDKIDLDRDIVVKDEMFKGFSDDELFLLVMGGEVNKPGMPTGFDNMMKAAEVEPSAAEAAKNELNERLEK